MYFVHNEASIFHKTIQKIEGEHISATEVILILNYFILQYKSQFEEKFLLLIIKRKLSDLEESNPGRAVKVYQRRTEFYPNVFSIYWGMFWSKNYGR